MNLQAKQIELEEEMHGAGILRFTKNNQRSVDSNQASDADWFRRLTREFVRPMADAIEAYKGHYEGRRGKPSATLSHLNCLSTEAAAYISIKTIFDSLTAQLPAQQLARTVGQRIEDEIRFAKLANCAPEYIGAIKDSLKKRSNQSYKFEHDSLVHAEKELNLLTNFQKLKEGGIDKLKMCSLLDIDFDKYNRLDAKAEFVIDIDRWVPWAQADLLQVGAKMIDIFANNMLLNGEPVVQKINISVSGAKQRNTPAAIVPTDALEQWVEQYKGVMSGLSPAFEPCVVQPRDWTSPFNGGYHSKRVSSTVNMIKCKDKRHLKRLSRSQMPEVYEAVNSLQAVKWQIHDKVLNVANEVRLRGLPLAMPAMDKQDKPVCPVPAIYADLRGADLQAALSDEQKVAFNNWRADCVAYYHDEQTRRSDVREAISTIDQALKFKDYDELHYVYTLDFRSRVYALGSLVSPQGGDLQKALIRFADTCALGVEGEYWFKVHGANVWAWDKEEFDTRVSNVDDEEFTDMCLDIAADPISFTQWTEADKPWQFLAWCFEYAELIDWKEEGNKASDFLSKVAVAMDGSCSGIQHYSAMLRDEIGGAEVNLKPAERPQDIYRAVANLDIEWLEAIVGGTERDCPIWDKIEAKIGRVKAYKMAEEWLRIGVTRSMTKKPVMTLPYGSSQLTCRASIEDYLKGLQSKADKVALSRGMQTNTIHQFTDKNGSMPLQEAISLASSLTWSGIGEVVVAARSAMKYIKQVTKVVAESGNALEWVTPLGFIVQQAVYEVTEDKQVFTSMLGGCKFRVKEITDKIDVRGMGSSCAPNFVHSMDASHLMKAVNYFKKVGINAIAVIHDSFGTHAGKTAQLRKALINSFVDMYQQNDVIAQFKERIECTLNMVIDVEVPTKGNLDLEEVRKSPYAFA